MRLRAQLVNAGLLSRIVMCMEKWNASGAGKTNQCFLHFSPRQLHLICGHDSATPPLHVHLQADMLLDDYIIESISNNEILLVLAVDSLQRALKSTHPSTSFSHLSVDVRMKLGKRDRQPLLTFLCTTQSKAGKPVTVTQSVPCEVLNTTDLTGLSLPRLGDLNLAIMLPPILALRTVVERLKSLDDRLIIAANNRGQFNVRIQTDTVQVTTYYQHLQHPKMKGQPLEEQELAEEFTETTVDIKQFARFLQVYHAQPQDIICCFHGNGGGLSLISFLGKYGETGDESGTLTYTIPSMYL